MEIRYRDFFVFGLVVTYGCVRAFSYHPLHHPVQIPVLFTESGHFLDVEGSGIFALHSACNHSCEPNAEVAFEGDSTLTLRAIEDIAQGDEICISYLEPGLLRSSRNTRHAELRSVPSTRLTCAVNKNEPLYLTARLLTHSALSPAFHFQRKLLVRLRLPQVPAASGGA